MPTEKTYQHVYICQFVAPGYDIPGMAAFDNAESVIDFASKLTNRGCYIKGPFKLGVLASAEEALKELGWKANGN